MNRTFDDYKIPEITSVYDKGVRIIGIDKSAGKARILPFMPLELKPRNDPGVIFNKVNLPLLFGPPKVHTCRVLLVFKLFYPF